MSNEEERFRKMVESSQDWFWEFDEDATFTYVSPRIRDLLGYEPEEVIGRNAFDLMDAGEAERVRKHFDPLAKKYLPFKRLENTNIHKDGHPVVIESSGTPVFDEEGRFRGYRGIDRDITDRKVAEEALRQSQKQLAETKQMAKVGSWQLNFEHNRLTWSGETCRIFGLKPQEFDETYEAFLKTVHPDDRDLVDDTFSGSLRDGQNGYEIEHRIIKQDTGEVRYVHEKCKHEQDASGAIVKSIGMVQDITERKAIELALHAAYQTAEAANSAKSLFLAKVSHEIRTPLTAIVGYGEMLEDADLSSEHRKYLAAINNASHTLSSLINDILDLSKIDSGELVIKQEDIRLRSFIGKLADLQKEQIANKGLVLDVSIGADVPDSLVGDPLRIQQVLLNLLGNAIKFTEQGSVSIAVAVAEANGPRVLLDIAVQDTGVGIAADLHERIFEPFVQGVDSSTQQYAGSGLGLSISRNLAGLMGGTVNLESQEGAGSTFHLLIPLQQKIDDIAKTPLPARDRLRWSGPALNILLTDDNPVNVQFIKAVLTKFDHKVMVAENGKIALEKLHTNAFDLVLMDIQMPVMDGVEALKVLRELEALGGKHLTVVAMTAYALMGDREKYLKMGFDGYLSKPFTSRELLNELVRVVPACRQTPAK